MRDNSRGDILSAYIHIQILRRHSNAILPLGTCPCKAVARRQDAPKASVSGTCHASGEPPPVGAKHSDVLLRSCQEVLEHSALQTQAWRTASG
jgi:hypothetical protein